MCNLHVDGAQVGVYVVGERVGAAVKVGLAVGLGIVTYVTGVENWFATVTRLSRFTTVLGSFCTNVVLKVLKKFPLDQLVPKFVLNEPIALSTLLYEKSSIVKLTATTMEVVAERAICEPRSSGDNRRDSTEVALTNVPRRGAASLLASAFSVVSTAVCCTARLVVTSVTLRPAIL
jgi:hypothetical protein